MIGYRRYVFVLCFLRAVVVVVAGRRKKRALGQGFVLRATPKESYVALEGDARDMRFVVVDSVRFGSFRFISVRFGSDRIGSVRSFGSIRFGTVRLVRSVPLRLVSCISCWCHMQGYTKK